MISHSAEGQIGSQDNNTSPRSCSCHAADTMNNVQPLQPCAEGSIIHWPYPSPQHLRVGSQSCQIHPLPLSVSSTGLPNPSTRDHSGDHNLPTHRVLPECNTRREGQGPGQRLPLCGKAASEWGLPVLLNTTHQLPAVGKHKYIVWIHRTDTWCWTGGKWVYTSFVRYQACRAAA
jgi:hypothetical protein